MGTASVGSCGLSFEKYTEDCGQVGVLEAQ